MLAFDELSELNMKSDKFVNGICFNQEDQQNP